MRGSEISRFWTKNPKLKLEGPIFASMSVVP